jgi:hypothetical protein
MAVTLRWRQDLNAAFDRRSEIIAVRGLQTAIVCETQTYLAGLKFGIFLTTTIHQPPRA